MPLLLPFFKFNPMDWLTSEKMAGMELHHIGAYINLLSQCWTTEHCTLPSHEPVLKKLCNWDDHKHPDFHLVLACFEPFRKTTRLYNPRLYREWVEAHERQDARRENGLKGAEKRWKPTPVKDQSPKSSAVWNAYAQEFQSRYGVLPVRNAKVNSMLCKVVERLGSDEAPSVASYYCAHTSALYLGAKHCVDLLLRDCEGLRMEWATGRRMTITEARNEDGKSARGQMWRDLMVKMDTNKEGT